MTKPDTYKAVILCENNKMTIHPIEEGATVPDFVTQWLKDYWDNAPRPSADQDACVFRIVYHEYLPNSFGDWAQEFLESGEDGAEQLPMLHILSGVDLNPDMYTPVEFPRSARILDSSVWNYCVWNDDGEEGFNSANVRLSRAVKEIYRNWQLKLYQLGSTAEYADLNARLAKNAYFKGGHHSEVISPFLFHSEYLTRKALKERLEKDTFCLGHKWRFLLVDDHAGEPLSKRGTDQPLPGGKNKLEIIVDRLQSLADEDHSVKVAWRAPGGCWNNENDYDIAIDSVCTVPDLVERLFGPDRKRYDIILLDYLLKASNSRNSAASYCYDFFYVLKSLRDIIEEKNLSEDTLNSIVARCEARDIDRKKGLAIEDGLLWIYGKVAYSVSDLNALQRWIKEGIGPKRRLYFMYISSFVHAIQERLEEQRISRAEKYWYIGRGACPVNTPEVFLFNLHLIMEKRYRKIIEKDEGGEFSSVPGFLLRIFDKDFSAARANVKTDCRSLFPELLRLKSVFEDLPLDLFPDAQEKGIEAPGSVLLGSIFKDWKVYSSDFWEHLQHLCYLISFGTVRQWPEWWEEYLFIRPVLEKTEQGKGIAGKIQEYIIGFVH